jgi:hypothetical protein
MRERYRSCTKSTMPTDVRSLSSRGSSGWLCCIWLFVMATGSSCTASHTPPDGGADAPSEDTSVVDAPHDSVVDAPVDTSRDSFVDAPVDAATPPTICGGAVCAADEFCCVLTGRCAAPGDASCSVPPDSGPMACASNADCDAEEFCRSPTSQCIGPGVCTPRDFRECSRNAPHCGCDGRTYRTACEAQRAGIRVARFEGACGSEGGSPTNPNAPLHPATCGTDENCSGTRCCLITGLCLPADCPDCCFDTTDQTGFYPCASDGYCSRYQRGDFCFALGCDGPGLCAPRGLNCGGRLDPVCGCDGSSYTNASCAQSAGVSVAHEGDCVP